MGGGVEEEKRKRLGRSWRREKKRNRVGEARKIFHIKVGILGGGVEEEKGRERKEERARKIYSI